MNTLDYFSTWNELQPKAAPRKAGLYAFFVGDELKYIGSSWCIWNRISGHPVKILLRKTYGDVKIVYHLTEKYINLERELILKYKPPHNKSLAKPRWYHA